MQLSRSPGYWTLKEEYSAFYRLLLIVLSRFDNCRKGMNESNDD